MNTLLRAGALVYAGIGVAAMAKPAAVPELFGGSAPTATSRTEIRAVYGGLPLAIAGAALASPRAAVTAGVLSAGMAAGRTASTFIEQEPSTPVTRFFIGLEVALAGALLLGGRSALKSRACGPAGCCQESNEGQDG